MRLSRLLPFTILGEIVMAEERDSLSVEEYDVHMTKVLGLPARTKEALLFLALLSDYFEMPEHFEDPCSGADINTLHLIHRFRLALEPILKAMPKEITDEISDRISRLIIQTVANY